MGNRVLVRNRTLVIQQAGQWVLQPGASEPIPIEIVPAFGDSVEVVQVVGPADVTIYRSPCKVACGHSLCSLTAGLSKALADSGCSVRHAKWRPCGPLVDQPRVVGGRGHLCNAATFEGPSGRWAWPHFDNDRAPRQHVAMLDDGWTGCICGSRSIAEGLVASGYPPERARVVNHCIDIDLYKPGGQVLDRWGDRFVFLSMGAMNPRKGFDIMLAAYERAAFKRSDNVILVLKNYSYGRDRWCREEVAAWQKRVGFEHPMIEYIYEQWTDAQIAAAYRRAAVHGAYLMPSRVEGFGLTGLEAMACGCRLGATGWSGQLDYADEDNATLFPFRMEPSSNNNEPGHEIYEPTEKPLSATADIGAVVAWMHGMVHEKPDRAKQDRIAKGLRERFSYAQMAKGFVDVLGLETVAAPRAPSIPHGGLAGRPIPSPTAVLAITKNETLGIGIPTRDRPTYLAMLLGGLLVQTKTPDALCIVDDSDAQGLLASDPGMMHLLALLARMGVRAEIVPGSHKGASPNHEIARQRLGTDLVLRLDDDLLPAGADFVARLYALINRDPTVGAVGGCYPEWREPDKDYLAARGRAGMRNELDAMLRGQADLQFRNWTFDRPADVVEAEHLYSSWMYRSAYLGALGGFATYYSRAGQREESDASVRLKFLGKHRLLVEPHAKAWHWLAGGGRRREFTTANARADDALFRAKLREWGIR